MNNRNISLDNLQERARKLLSAKKLEPSQIHQKSYQHLNQNVSLTEKFVKDNTIDNYNQKKHYGKNEAADILETSNDSESISISNSDLGNSSTKIIHKNSKDHNLQQMINNKLNTLKLQHKQQLNKTQNTKHFDDAFKYKNRTLQSKPNNQRQAIFKTRVNRTQCQQQSCSNMQQSSVITGNPNCTMEKMDLRSQLRKSQTETEKQKALNKRQKYEIKILKEEIYQLQYHTSTATQLQREIAHMTSELDLLRNNEVVQSTVLTELEDEKNNLQSQNEKYQNNYQKLKLKYKGLLKDLNAQVQEQISATTDMERQIQTLQDQLQEARVIQNAQDEQYAKLNNEHLRLVKENRQSEEYLRKQIQQQQQQQKEQELIILRQHSGTYENLKKDNQTLQYNLEMAQTTIERQQKQINEGEHQLKVQQDESRTQMEHFSRTVDSIQKEMGKLVAQQQFQSETHNNNNDNTVVDLRDKLQKRDAQFQSQMVSENKRWKDVYDMLFQDFESLRRQMTDLEVENQQLIAQIRSLS